MAMTPFNNYSNFSNSGGSSSNAGTDLSGGNSSAARSAMRDRAKRWISTSVKKQEQSGSSSASAHLDENNSPNREKTLDNNAVNEKSANRRLTTPKQDRSALFGHRSHYVDRMGNVTVQPSSSDNTKLQNGNDKFGNKQYASKSSTVELSDAAVESSLQAWDEIAEDDKVPHYKPKSTLFDVAITTAKLRRGNNIRNAIQISTAATVSKSLTKQNVSRPSEVVTQHARHSINITGSSQGRVSKIAERLVNHGRTPSPACPSDECYDSSVPSPSPNNDKRALSPIAFSPVSFHPPTSTTDNDEIDKELAYWIDQDSDSAYSSDSSGGGAFAKGKNSLQPRAPPLTQRTTVVAHKKEQNVAASNIVAKPQPIKVLQKPLQIGTGITSKSPTTSVEVINSKATASPPITLKSAFVNGNLKSKEIINNDETTIPPRSNKSSVIEKYQQAVATRTKSPYNIESRPLKATVSSSMPCSKAKVAYDQSMGKLIIPPAIQSTQQTKKSHRSTIDLTTGNSHEPITHRPSPRRPVLYSGMNQHAHKEKEPVVASKANSETTGEPAAEAVWKIESIFSQKEKPNIKNAPSSFQSQSSQPVKKHGLSAFETPKKKSELETASSTDSLISSGIDLSASEQRYYASTGRNVETLKFSSPPTLCRTAGVIEPSADLVQAQPLSEAALSLQNVYSPMRRPVNGVAVPGYEGFINKTSDMPNLMDQCSVASGVSSILEETKMNPSWSLRQRIPRISEDVEPSDIFDGLSSNDGEDPPPSPALDAAVRGTEEQSANMTNPIHTLDTQSPIDLSKYYIDPEVAQQLILKYRKMCLRKRNRRDEDHKKAFALFEMRSRVMENDIERGLPRQGGTTYTDDIILTSSNLAAIRVRDTTIVSKAWRDGASPRDLIMASLLTRKSTHCYFVKRPLFEYNRITGAEIIRGHYFEEVRWLDDSDLFQLRCASLDLMPVRGYNIFTLGDCHSLLLKLTNERCLQLHDELEAAYERQLNAEQQMELESHSGATDKATMTDVEMTYLTSLQEVSEISNKLEQAERAFSMVQDGIAKLIAKYEAHLAAMYQNSSFDSSTFDEEEIEEDEALAARAAEAERKAKAAEQEALKAKEEAERIRKIKDNEVQSLKSRVEELERQTAAERERSQNLLRQYELKIENLERQSAVGLDSRSMFQHSIHSTQATEKVESVKKKFRSRHFERLNKNSFLEKSNAAKTIGKVKQLSKQFERPTAISSLTNRGAGMNAPHMSEEEMFQHLDFYERVAKGNSLIHI